MNRWFRWLDSFFATALAASMAMVIVTAWPSAARAAERTIGSGQSATESRSVGDFDAVQTRGPRVIVRHGAAPAVTVQADGNLLPLIETMVEDTAQGRTLVVRWKRGANVVTRAKAAVTVAAPRLSALTVLGSGEIEGQQLVLPRLVVSVSGSGDVHLDGLDIDDLSLDIRGSGDITAYGRAGRLQIRVAGSGDVKTDGLKAKAVSVRIAGSGDAAVNAQDTLAVAIVGSGEVVYSGNATVTQKVAGSGSVTRR